MIKRIAVLEDIGYSAFEVLAPFDIGASIYEDIDPILAVLSNIVTRGLPTKCSPFIEETLNKVFDYAEVTEKYGTIRYEWAEGGIIIEDVYESQLTEYNG